jgi:diamine N-acetyltransferase
MQIIIPTEGDVPRLQALMREVFTETFGHLYPPADLAHYLDTAYATDQLRSEVVDHWNYWQLALDNAGEPMAYLECVPAHLPHPEVRPEEHGEIERIYVLKRHQGKGLGRKLMTLALEHLDQRYGKAPQWLGVWSENLRAQALYRSYGFEKVGEYTFPVGDTHDHEFIFCRVP